MNNLNSHLTTPKSVQQMIDAVENQPLYLAEIAIAEHPKLSNFNRFVRVNGISTNSQNEFVQFDYRQVLKDKETGEETKIVLPVPEWVVYKDTWSYFRDAQNKPVALTVKTDITDDELPKDADGNIEKKVRVSSYRYMLWLMANNKAGLLQLIQGYLADFVRVKQEELDRL